MVLLGRREKRDNVQLSAFQTIFFVDPAEFLA
jgi:hypothetical protein